MRLDIAQERQKAQHLIKLKAAASLLFLFLYAVVCIGVFVMTRHELEFDSTVLNHTVAIGKAVAYLIIIPIAVTIYLARLLSQNRNEQTLKKLLLKSYVGEKRNEFTGNGGRNYRRIYELNGQRFGDLRDADKALVLNIIDDGYISLDDMFDTKLLVNYKVDDVSDLEWLLNQLQVIAQYDYKPNANRSL